MSEPRLTNGQSWRFDAPVVACVYDINGIGAFALGDGTLRVFAADQPPKTIDVHRGAILALSAHPEGGFLTGGDDGRLVHTTLGEPPREISGRPEAAVRWKQERWIRDFHRATSGG